MCFDASVRCIDYMLPATECSALDLATTAASWLLNPDGGVSSDVLWEPRFASLLERTLPAITPPFCNGASLQAAVFEFLSGPTTVLVVENRYFVATACKRHFGRSKGLLWIDCRTTPPAIGFVARSYHQPTEERVAICFNNGEAGLQVPPQLLAQTIRWLSSEGNQNITELAIYDSTGGTRYLDPQIIGTPPRRMMSRRAKRRKTRK